MKMVYFASIFPLIPWFFGGKGGQSHSHLNETTLDWIGQPTVSFEKDSVRGKMLLIQSMILLLFSAFGGYKKIPTFRIRGEVVLIP